LTGQCAETIQETIGAHYTLILNQKENENGVSNYIWAVSQQIVFKGNILPESPRAINEEVAQRRFIQFGYNQILFNSFQIITLLITLVWTSILLYS
jgi:hypothetical protein